MSNLFEKSQKKIFLSENLNENSLIIVPFVSLIFRPLLFAGQLKSAHFFRCQAP